MRRPRPPTSRPRAPCPSSPTRLQAFLCGLMVRVLSSFQALIVCFSLYFFPWSEPVCHFAQLFNLCTLDVVAFRSDSQVLERGRSLHLRGRHCFRLSLVRP